MVSSRQFWHLNFALRAIVLRAFCPLKNFYISVNFRYCPHNNLPSQQFLDLAYYYTHLPFVFCLEGKWSSGPFALSTIFYISVNFISGQGRTFSFTILQVSSQPMLIFVIIRYMGKRSLVDLVIVHLV